MSTMEQRATAEMLDPVRKSVTVNLPPEDAFALFTEGLATWWPLDSHSVYAEEADTCVLEPRVGGRMYERTGDGRESVWAEVVEWQPPTRILLNWHAARGPETAQEVEIWFRPVTGGTTVELEHRRWERLGDGAAEVRDSYEPGWEFILRERYGAAAGG